MLDIVLSNSSEPRFWTATSSSLMLVAMSSSNGTSYTKLVLNSVAKTLKRRRLRLLENKTLTFAWCRPSVRLHFAVQSQRRPAFSLSEARGWPARATLSWGCVAATCGCAALCECWPGRPDRFFADLRFGVRLSPLKVRTACIFRQRQRVQHSCNDEMDACNVFFVQDTRSRVKASRFWSARPRPWCATVIADNSTRVSVRFVRVCRVRSRSNDKTRRREKK